MYKLQKPHSTSRVKCSIRAIYSWNGLPEHVVTAKSLNESKNNLDDFLSEQFFDY